MKNKLSVWYINSGCCNHMTSQKSLLTNVDKNVTFKLKMENGELVQATGHGTLVIETKYGTKHIKEVWIVPGLDENLLSVRHMVQHGYFLVTPWT